MILKLQFFFFLFIISLCSYSQTTVLTYGSSWKYLDNGSDQGTAWSQTGFNDASWASGNAQLGYGDNDETTVVTGNKTTYYFRSTFNISNLSTVGGLSLNLLYDDGAVIYINGVEVHRENMPTGTILYTTTAYAAPSENATVSVNISNSSLVQGTNIIAVEVHNVTPSSSDISFDLEVTTLPVSQSNIVDYGDLWKYLDDGSDQGIAWSQAGFNDASWASGNAQLGFGDGDENTVLTGGEITYYFRKNVNITSLTNINSLDIEFLHDDGGIVYINGVEVFRTNMPAGTVNYLTQAYGSPDNNVVTANVTASNLVVGTNTIAVEVHNASTASSDISFDLEIVPSSNYPQSADLIRGPYLQMPNPTEITLKWRTTSSNVGKVIYGTSINNLSTITTEITTKTDHEIRLTGLAPNTKYYYAICTLNDTLFGYGNSNSYFITSPNIGDKSKKRIWVLGDAGTANSNQRKVRDAYYSYQSNHTDLILQLGDNAYQTGTDSEFQDAMFENMYEDILVQTPVWSCIGNHESYSLSISNSTGPYFDIYSFPKNAECGGVPSGTENYYSFDYGNIHFIVLNSMEANRDSTGPMLTWAKNDIQNTSSQWVVALWHHPPYTKGSHDSDAESRHIDMREHALPFLERYGVDLVLGGHSHSYERSFLLNGHYGSSSTFNASTMVLNGTSGKYTVDCVYGKKTTGTDAGKGSVYIVSGSAGQSGSGSLNHPAMYYSVSDLGSTYLEVEDNRMDIFFIDEYGNVDDELTLMKDVPKVIDTTILNGTTINLEASWVGDYYWSVGGSTTRTLSQTITAPTTITVNDGVCLTDTFNIQVIGFADIDELTKKDFSVYPNPATGNSLIEIKANTTVNIDDLFLVNKAGQIISVSWKKTTEGVYQITLPNLSIGSYEVIIINNNKTYKESIIIKD